MRGSLSLEELAALVRVKPAEIEAWTSLGLLDPAGRGTFDDLDLMRLMTIDHYEAFGCGGGDTAQQFFDDLYATPEDSPGGQDLWFPAPAALPDPSVLFSTPVYDRGAMTLQALREKVGDDTFFSMLRTWYADHRGGNVTTDEFTALAEQISGQDLDHFFHVWLYEEGRPTSW